MVCDTHHSLRRFLKCDVFTSQGDSQFTNLGNEDDIEKSLSSVFIHKFVTLIPINPQLAFISWHIDEKAALHLKEDISAFYENYSLVLRIYDITDVNFDGFNARTQFDIDIGQLSGCHYQQVEHIGCMLMAEVGFKCSDYRFVPCARSNTMFFKGPSDFSSGLYINHEFNRFYNINEPLSGQRHFIVPSKKNKGRLSVAVFLNEPVIIDDYQSGNNLSRNIRLVLDRIQQSNIDTSLFAPMLRQNNNPARPFVDFVCKTSMQSLDTFNDLHRKNPFHCVQSHNWYSAPAAISAASDNHLPFISVFHSLELERKSRLPVSQCQLIESLERKSIIKADMVLVSRESTRKLITEHYGKPEDCVAVVEDFADNPRSSKKETENKVLPFNLSADQPILLFAGEMTAFSGVDLIIESLPNVCREFPSARFVFAGEGELRWVFENRVKALNAGRNCCFTGHLDSFQFDCLFDAAYALLLPFRHKYQNELTKRAMQSGLTILTTHQASIEGIRHGFNGLLVYDNPGSVCWGIKEILSGFGKNRSGFSGHGDSIIESIAGIYSDVWMNLALTANGAEF